VSGPAHRGPAGATIDTELLVIGGGIAGAGVALEAARRGVSTLLVEARDFAWGSSSRSSKLVHGGLRYLREGAFGLTRESVRERDRLLADAPGLVEPQRFLLGHYAGRPPGRATVALGLALYDAFGGRRTRAHLSAAETRRLAPPIAADGLLGASSYLDARTDDARLVLRVLQEAQAHGARVVNGAAVHALLRAGADGVPAPPGTVPGTVVGARVQGPGLTGTVRARCVVNATGAWADGLRAGLGTPMLRPLRGSHLVFPAWRLPLAQSVSLLHPRDGRPVFATPWEGATLVGTTDLDHADPPGREPAITATEVVYLMEAMRTAFPRLDLRPQDAVCSFSGVRPVVDEHGARDPSKAPREHVVRDEHGLVTVTGGKLTTFRVHALDALRHAAPHLGGARDFRYARAAPILEPVGPDARLAALPHGLRARLSGRFGPRAGDLVGEGGARGLALVPGTATPWAELHWALRHEQVRHLDDLLFRRTRFGLLLPAGAAALLPRLEGVAREALGWSAGEWRDECERHARLVADCHAIPLP